MKNLLTFTLALVAFISFSNAISAMTGRDNIVTKKKNGFKIFMAWSDRGGSTAETRVTTEGALAQAPTMVPVQQQQVMPQQQMVPVQPQQQMVPVQPQQQYMQQYMQQQKQQYMQQPVAPQQQMVPVPQQQPGTVLVPVQ